MWAKLLLFSTNGTKVQILIVRLLISLEYSDREIHGGYAVYHIEESER